MNAAIEALWGGAKITPTATMFGIRPNTLREQWRREQDKREGLPPGEVMRRKARGDATKKVRADLIEAAKNGSHAIFELLGLHITETQPEALTTMVEAMAAMKWVKGDGGEMVEVPDHAVRMKAADSLLDRGGYLPRLRDVRVNSDQAGKVPESVEEIRRRIERREGQITVLEARGEE